MTGAIRSTRGAACAVMVLGVALVAPTPASATLTVKVEALFAEASASTSTDTAIHGFARTAEFPDIETAFAGPGPAGPCDFQPLLSGCGVPGFDIARAVGEIFAPDGRFRALATAPEAGAQVDLTLVDTLVVAGTGPVAFDIHLSAVLESFADFSLGVLLLGPEILPGVPIPLPIFGFERTLTSGSEDVFIEERIPLDDVTTGFLCLFLPGACGPTPVPGTELPLMVLLSARAESGGKILADSTAFLGVEGATSTSGYAYPFRVGPTQVPVPATALLVLVGVAATWANRARRR